MTESKLHRLLLHKSISLLKPRTFLPKRNASVPHVAKGEKMNMQNPRRFLDRDKVFIAQNPDWTIVNNGGSGDCTFRCAAYSIAKQQQKDLGPEAMIREGSRLRVLATGHLTAHKAS